MEEVIRNINLPITFLILILKGKLYILEKRLRPESNREIPKETGSQDQRSTIVPRRLNGKSYLRLIKLSLIIINIAVSLIKT